MKVIPQRMDIVSRESLPKDSLLRFVLKEGTLIFDKEQKLPGRGVYLAPANLEDKRIEKAFSKAFRTPITIKMIKEALNG